MVQVHLGRSHRRTHIATRKFQVATLGREEAIAKSWPDEQKPNTKAYQADKLAKDNKVPKGDRNLAA